jgi:uncharacterized membrane protein
MPRRAGNRNGALITVFLLLIALVAVTLIGISPIALGIFHGATGKWERLSLIGQTYGAASAIISVLALVGISLSFEKGHSPRSDFAASRTRCFRAGHTPSSL